MWTEKWGFVVSPEEQAEVNYRRSQGRKAPDLFCTRCKGNGFIHPIFAEQVQWDTVIPCDCLTADIKANRYQIP